MLDIRQTAAPKKETAVVCRPAGTVCQLAKIAVLLAPVLVIGILFFTFLITGSVHPSTSTIWGGGWLGSWTLPPGIWGILYLTKARIIADEQELRWRETGSWHKSAWKDIASYSNGKPGALGSSQIKTSDWTLTIAPGSWTSEDALREFIQRHATEAVQSGWHPPEPKTLRVPFECHYDTRINRNILGWMATIHKYGLLIVAVYFALQWFMTHTLPGWGWLLTPTGLFVIAKQTLPLCWRSMYRATQPRLEDKVIADKDGLRFESGDMSTLVAWADIVDFYDGGIRSVVVARAGGEYDFLSTLTDADRLRAVIPYMAVNARCQGWRTGIVQRRQVTDRDGQHSVECVYRYRSWENCFRLWGLTLAALLLAGIAVGLVLIARQSGSVPSWRELSLAVGGLLGFLTLGWLWGNYWRGAIRTNEEGITQQTLLGRRFLAWGQVRAFRWCGGADLTWGCVEGISGTLTFWKGIGDADRLVDEIAAHGVTVR